MHLTCNDAFVSNLKQFIFKSERDGRTALYSVLSTQKYHSARYHLARSFIKILHSYRSFQQIILIDYPLDHLAREPNQLSSRSIRQSQTILLGYPNESFSKIIQLDIIQLDHLDRSSNKYYIARASSFSQIILKDYSVRSF